MLPVTPPQCDFCEEPSSPAPSRGEGKPPSMREWGVVGGEGRSQRGKEAKSPDPGPSPRCPSFAYEWFGAAVQLWAQTSLPTALPCYLGSVRGNQLLCVVHI